MKLICAGTSRKGQVRRNNEDAILMRSSDKGALFLVADGIGSREHGELVSGLLRDSYNQWWENRFWNSDMDFQHAVNELKQVLFYVNREIFNRFGQFNAGSTLVLLFLFRGYYLCISSGDSRIYLARRFTFRQITTDDIYGSTGESAGSTARGKLLSAVGIREMPEFSIRTDTLQNGDRFFLCSDGVYRYIAPKRLRRYIFFIQKEPERLVSEVSKNVEQSGASDNYSMIYIHIQAK